MLGFLIVLVSSFFFCFQNVIVRVLFNEYSVFGVFQTGGFVEPTLQNLFLLMFMRMVLVVPLMALLVSKLYSPTWKELGRLRSSVRDSEQRQLLWQSIGVLIVTCSVALLSIERSAK